MDTMQPYDHTRTISAPAKIETIRDLIERIFFKKGSPIHTYHIERSSLNLFAFRACGATPKKVDQVLQIYADAGLLSVERDMVFLPKEHRHHEDLEPENEEGADDGQEQA